MSDAPMQDRHNGGIRWVPLSMSVGLVLFTLAVVAYGQLTGVGTLKTGANQIHNVGTVWIERANDGTIVVIDNATKDLLASYPPTGEQFIAGALRSLNRMRGAPADAADRTYHVLRIGAVSVMLEDTETGDRISLNAFNRAAADALANTVAAVNGGTQ